MTTPFIAKSLGASRSSQNALLVVGTVSAHAVTARSITSS
jgi:hypothetical protein